MPYAVYDVCFVFLFILFIVGCIVGAQVSYPCALFYKTTARPIAGGIYGRVLDGQFSGPGFFGWLNSQIPTKGVFATVLRKGLLGVLGL